MRPDYWKDCTIECERVVECVVCRKRKPPRGRSVPMELYSSYCTHECKGYDVEPSAGHLWPGELAHMDSIVCPHCYEEWTDAERDAGLHLCIDEQEPKP